MKKVIIIFLFLIVYYSIFTNNGFAQFPIQRVILNGNNISAYFQNTGIFDQNTTSGNAPGFEWPKGSGNTAIFTMGLTIAGYYNNTFRMSSASYYGEYSPGFSTAGIPQTNSNFHIYTVKRGDNSYNNPDYANWGFMVPYGAPFIDMNNNGTYEAEIDTPGVSVAYQTIFICLTDGFANRHNAAEGFGGGTAPLYSELHMTAWCYNEAELQDVQFIKWDVINKGNYAWDSTIFSIVCDPDLGSANDDYIGCDTTRNLGYCYNSTNYDAMYGSNPPAVGVALLKGAFNKYVIPNQNIGMSSFDYFTNSSTSPPPCESDPNADTIGAYRFMSGFKKDLSCWLNPTIISGSRKTKFCYPADPLTMTGWTEYTGSIHNCGGDTTGQIIIPNPAGDRRFLLNSGKVKVNPGDKQTIIIAQLIAQQTSNVFSNLSSVSKLKIFTDSVKTFYNNAISVGLNNISTLIPIEFKLEQNYPNPFNPISKIKYQIAKTKIKNQKVQLIIYNSLGQEIETLVNQTQEPGTYEVTFDGSNYASGVYFYRLTADSFSEIKKMILLK